MHKINVKDVINIYPTPYILNINFYYVKYNTLNISDEVNSQIIFSYSQF